MAKILLVEDNPADVELLEIALVRCDSQFRLNLCKDGEEALDYLYQRGVYAKASWRF